MQGQKEEAEKEFNEVIIPRCVKSLGFIFHEGKKDLKFVAGDKVRLQKLIHRKAFKRTSFLFQFTYADIFLYSVLAWLVEKDDCPVFTKFWPFENHEPRLTSLKDRPYVLDYYKRVKEAPIIKNYLAVRKSDLDDF